MSACPKKATSGVVSLIAVVSSVLMVPEWNVRAQSPAAQTQKPRWNVSANGRVRFAKAYVVDQRLSALRREPNLRSTVLQRLRVARAVYVLQSRIADQTRFYRVAVTRRTRGWIHESAIAVPGRLGQDQRVLELITIADDPIDRLTLCKLFIDRFKYSTLVPRALLLMGEEADRAATSLIGRASRRLARGSGRLQGRMRDLYLSDSGLDRYSKLNVFFAFDETSRMYEYDGWAYREILRRYPRSEEAEKAWTAVGGRR